ncbi:MAG: HNH endonuclease signature motif containing protein [Candidatus Paceibacterota bacterium]
MNCINCEREAKTRHQIKFCSNKCQLNYQYKIYIKSWKSGKQDGNKGILTKGMSGHIRKYLIEKYGEACSICGWDERYTITGKVPLEIDHIDGNSDNNNESNLRLICPNCHALTPHFRNLNKGKGRKWRIEMIRRNK